MFSRYWRHILFVLFAAGFLISAPLVVLFTAGYRYHFESGKIVQTGVLNVSSIPKGATVFLDDLIQKERTPAVISNVIPGDHIVRVEKDGYSSWKKTMEISSKQSTFSNQVVLFLQLAPEIRSASELPKPPSIKPIWRQYPPEFHLQNTQDRTVLSRIDSNNLASILAYLPLSTYHLEPSPDPYLMLRDETRKRIVLIDTRDQSQPIILNTDAEQWSWSPSGDALLFSDSFDIEVYIPSSHARETITRLSHPIFGLTWYPLGYMTVFGYEGTIYAQELDRHGEPNKTTLLEGLDVTQFWFEEDGTWLVGLTSDGNGFRKRLQR